MLDPRTIERIDGHKEGGAWGRQTITENQAMVQEVERDLCEEAEEQARAWLATVFQKALATEYLAQVKRLQAEHEAAMKAEAGEKAAAMARAQDLRAQAAAEHAKAAELADWMREHGGISTWQQKYKPLLEAERLESVYTEQAENIEARYGATTFIKVGGVVRGIEPPDHTGRVLAELAAKLEAWPDPEPLPLGNRG